MEGVAAEPKPLVWGAHDIFKDGSVRITVSALRSTKARTPRPQTMTRTSVVGRMADAHTSMSAGG